MAILALWTLAGFLGIALGVRLILADAIRDCTRQDVSLLAREFPHLVVAGFLVTVLAGPLSAAVLLASVDDWREIIRAIRFK